jgi:hypothetical protein
LGAFCGKARFLRRDEVFFHAERPLPPRANSRRPKAMKKALPGGCGQGPPGGNFSRSFDAQA